MLIDLGRVMAKGSSLEPLLSEWVRRTPQASVAHLFKGYFHHEQGGVKRGRKYARETSPEQFLAMGVKYGIARGHLKEAIRLDPSLGLAFAALISIEVSEPESIPVTPSAARKVHFENQQDGRDDSPTSTKLPLEPVEMSQSPMGLPLHLLNLALKVDPGSVAVRLFAVGSFSPKWGGSFELLDHLQARPENSKLKAADQSYLSYRILMEKADHQRTIAKQQREAMRYAILAHPTCSSKDALWLASESGYDLVDWKTVRDLMTQSLVLGENGAYIYSKRGFAAENMGDMSAAVQDYEKAIQLDQAWAMNRIGWFYETGRHLPKDLKKAKALYERAAEKGNPTAKESLSKMIQGGG